MDSTAKGWKMATGVLVLVVIILLFMMWQQWDREQHNLGFVLEQGKQDVTQARNDIEAKCRGPQANEADCQAALDGLASILKEFSKDVNQATSAPSTQ